MTLTSGFRLGPYEIVAPLGAGGMGEVYRARDSRLGRDVAVKSLPTASTADADRIARFRREAQILAGLSHPHIAALYGLEEAAGSQFLVMELVEGGTLANRLAQGPLPLRDALTIARQVADALQAAHDRGIIHRDLKPANIALTTDGHTKVLDFGLAKAFSAESDAPTVATGATKSGVVLGTAAYMSPEQARGLPLDKRSDIFAFGCVLYEMLTAHNPFGAESVSDIIVAILGREPDWTLLPPGTPSRVQWLLRRCLEKDPRRRLHDIADARIELDEALMNPSESGGIAAAAAPTTGVMRTGRRELAAWAVAGLALAGLIGVLALRQPPQTEGDGDHVYRATIALPDQATLLGEDAARLALSPDGRRFAFVAAVGDGRSMLWVRSLDGLIAQPLAGTEGALNPFWSPDSQFIGFIQRPVDVITTVRGQLKKIHVGGGQPVTIATINFTAPASWSRDNVILFTPAGNSPLHKVPAGGGEAVPATALDTGSGEVQHSFPHFLPDGRRFLYTAVGSTKGGATAVRAVLVGSLDSNEPPRLILERASNAMYANGHLVFLRSGTLFAQPFDADRLQLHGEPTALAERVLTGGAVSGAFSVSSTGILVYQTTPPYRSQLAWFDRSGVRLRNLGDDQADYVDVVLSPNGARAAVSVMEPELGTRDIWIFDVARGLRDRLTTTQTDEFAPVWSPRGDRLAYSAAREGILDIYEKATGGAEQRLGTGGIDKYAASWSPDERTILYIGGGRIIARSDLMLLPLEGDRRPKPYVDTEFVETQGRFSPDGRWIAYSSNHTGRMEVYVRAYPASAEPERVSDNGGGWPQWRRDGAELFFIGLDNTLMAAAVNGQGSAFQVNGVRPLFQTRPRPRVRLDAYFYDVAPDGQRFLINTLVEGQVTTPPIMLVVNWPSLLKK